LIQIPKVSVFTPSHNPRYLDAAYASLKAQTEQDWEWVVLLNGDPLPVWTPPEDSRVVVIFDGAGDGRVGRAKGEAVRHCTAPVLVELDHDDELEPEALSELLRAVAEHPDAGMYYSKWTQIQGDGEPDGEPDWNAENGWVFEQEESTRGKHSQVEQHHTPLPMPVTPHNLGYIWYAPNHFRAFTRSAYDASGGYDETRAILDDQDLMNKLYLVGDFVYIDKVLYRQRMHAKNTQFALSADIQTGTHDVYEQYIEATATKWSERNGLKVGVWEDIRLQVQRPDEYGMMKIIDGLQTFEDPVKGMKLIHDGLAPNGMLLTLTPSADGAGAFMHPPAKSFWNEASFWHYTQGENALFQISRLRTFYPSEYHQANGLAYVQANLIAVKPGYVRQGGYLANQCYVDPKRR
jgi:glycosyltransferase involved in cell wall biosynthesis